MQTISLQRVLELVNQYWNIEGSIKNLPSYTDQNFKITTNDAAYVFKIANPQWSYDDLALENAALLHLENMQVSLTIPKVIASLDGEYLIPLIFDDADNEKPCYLRLLTYVEGDIYANVAALKSQTPNQRSQLLFSLGVAVGKVAFGMRDFSHANAKRELDWNLMRLPLLHDEIAQVEEEEEVDLQLVVHKHMQYFIAQLPNWLHTLPTSVNHNDANDFNVIVDPKNHQSVCSIIDFGDTCFSFRIADLAITCTYAMQFEEDIVDCMTNILRGYHQENPLQINEVKVLYAFVMGRLCQSILMANKAIRLNPANTYILVSQQAVRRLIRHLDAMDSDIITQQFLHSITHH
jgi:Ser/Thr protein kinase RdoA (MazF antagonist)